MPIKRSTIVSAFALALAFATIAALLILTRPVKRPPLETIPPLHVTALEVRPVDLRPIEMVTGRVQPVRRAVLRFEVAGRVVERAVEPGQRVGTGKVLLRLDDGDFRDALAEAEAQLELERSALQRDRALLALAERNRRLQEAQVRRLERLGRDSLASRTRLDEARRQLIQLQGEETRLRAAVDTGQARLALRESAVTRARRNLARTRLEAPFAGTVNRVHVDVGDYVSPSQPAVELVDLEALDVYAEVRGNLAAALDPGREMRVLLGDAQVAGRVVAVQRDPDPTTFTHGIRVRIPRGAAQPGDLARLEAPLPPIQGALVVPVSAALRENGRSYVFVVRDGNVSRVPVRLGRRVDDMFVVRDGLSPGALVVARDVASLSDGQAVVVDQPSSGGG